MGFLDDLKKKALNVASRAYDQVNIADGGRTWKQRTPTKQGGVGSQLYNSGAGNIARGAGRTAQRSANSLSALPASLGGLVWIGKESVFGNDKSYQNAIDTTSDALNYIADKGWGNQGSYFSSKNINSSGDGWKGMKENFIKPTTKAVADVAPYVVPAGGVGQGGKLLTKVATQAAVNGGVSGATNAAAQWSDKGNIDTKEVAANTLLGGLIGGAVPAAGAGVKAASNRFAARLPLNEVGAIGDDVIAGSKKAIKNADNAIAQSERIMAEQAGKPKTPLTAPPVSVPSRAPQPTSDPNRNWKLSNQVDEGYRVFSDTKELISQKMDEFTKLNNGKPFTPAQKKELQPLLKQMEDGLNLAKKANTELYSASPAPPVSVPSRAPQPKAVPPKNAQNFNQLEATNIKVIDDANRAIAQSEILMGKNPPVTPPVVPPQAAKPMLPPVTGPANQKLSRFANKTVQNSDEVSVPLKKMVREEQAGYMPHTNQGRLDVAEKFLKGKSNNSAYTHVTKRLENPKFNDQDAVTALALAKKLDASGKEDDLFKATEIYATLSKRFSESGQTTQAASLLSVRTPQGLLYTAQKNLRKGGVDIENNPQLQLKLKEMIDNIKAQKPGTYEDGLARFQLMDFVNKQVKSPIASKGVNLWKAGLLTAPSTTAGNLAANTFEQTYKRAWNDPVAAAADAVMSVFTGKRTKSLTYRGIGSGAKEGAQKGVSYFKTGYDPRNPLTKFDIQEIHYSNTPLGKAAENYTQAVFKLMGSQDQPFYYASLRNSLMDQAVTEAKNAGLKGEARRAFIKKFTTQPSKKAMQLADDEARYDVFQNKTGLGDIASGIKDKSGALGEFIVPFSQVPSSIATRMIDRTPVGLGKEIIKQIKAGKFNQRAMSRAVADASAGIAIMGAGASLVKSGDIALGFPQDQKERDLWELEGKQANSIKVGDKWISLNYFQPLGTILAAGANYQKALDEGASKTDAFAAAAAGGGKALTEQSFLKGVSGTLNALTDPQRSAEKFAENTAGSVVPNIIRSGARSFDPVNRVQDGLGEAVKSGIPGLRQTLPVKTDIFGRPVERKTSAINSLINPLKPSDVRDPGVVGNELRRLYNVDEGTTATRILKDALGGDTKLNRDQQLELKNQIGQELQGAWSQIISDPRYAQLSDQDKKKRLDDVKDDITGAFKKRYATETMKLPEDPKKAPSAEERAVLNGTPTDYLSKKTSGSYTSSSNEPNDAEYKDLLAEYETNTKTGAYSKAEAIRAKNALDKAKVGANFSKEVREMYGLSKSDLYDFVANDPNGKKYAEDVIAYGDALVEAGVMDYNKFRTKKGAVSIRPKEKSSGGGGRKGRKGKGKGNSRESLAGVISMTGKLSSAARGAKVSKTGFSSKIRGPGLQAYKRSSGKRVSVQKKQLVRSNA